LESVRGKKKQKVKQQKTKNMNYKFQQTLERYGIDGLTDEVLAPEFVESAKEFLDFAKNPESKPEQINAMDEKLCALFFESHEIEENQNLADSDVEAKRMTSTLNAKVEDYQAKIDSLEAANRQKDEQLARYKQQEEEREQRTKQSIENKRQQQQQQQNQEGEKAAAFQQKLDTIVAKGRVDFDEMELLGVPNIGSGTIHWNGLVFKRAGLVMSRYYSVYDERNKQ
jgi:hypothetical protein